MRNIDMIRSVSAVALNRWPEVLSGLGIDVPASPRAQVACPACGGTDRFRFDDDGRGAHFCNQCGAGDGLELVKKVRQCDATTAAQLVAGVLGIDGREAVSVHAGQDASQKEALRQQQAAKQVQEQQQRRATFTTRYQAKSQKTTPGESAYLTRKGLTGFTVPVLPDGTILLPLVDGSGTVTAAQTITSQGEKRLLTGSVKRGTRYAVNATESPQTVIIAEGLATALSIHLMRPDALTVVAIDAGNLIHVAQVMRHQHPQVQIIIAADNDHHDDGQANTGKDAAEKAAKSITGWVALPQSEEKADWNDIHQQNGTEAAAAAFNASMYQPEGKHVKPQLKAIEGGKVNQPEQDPLKSRIESRKDGVYWVSPKVDKDSGEIINHESWLSGVFSVIGEGKDEDTGKNYIAFQWLDDGKPVTRLIECGAIGDRDGWRSMKDGGLKVTTKTSLRAILSDWIQHLGDKAPRIIITPRAGWCHGVYVMPDGEVIGESDVPVMFNGGSAAARAYCVAGTVESWRDKVAALAVGNPFMMLAVGVALAAPMMKLMGAASFGIHLFASSTASKTTTADLATSLYGEPNAQRLTWYGTALGIANEAEAHNDGLLSLDEIGQGTRPRDVYTSAYTLFNGKGKLQGNKDGGNRVLKHWETVAISTGEVSIETFLLTEGIKVKAGQLVRLLNIPVTRPAVFHGYTGGKELADAINEAGAENYGAAGREWIKWLSANQKQVKAAYQAAKQRWAALIPQSYGEQVRRVSDRFAAIEAALVLGSIITGWDIQACRDALQHSFNAWVKEFGTGNKEHLQIIAQTEAFLNAHGLSRFAPVEYDPRDLPIRDLAGYRKEGQSEGDPMIFYTFPAVFDKEIASPFSKDVVAQVLYDVGMLQKPGSGKGWQIRTPRLKHLNGAQCRVYGVLLTTPDETEEESE
ncbi:MAG: DUF927 domain-containing protein [Yokenella regensburgei]|nr:DUF927 domain-containing protein [Yokenella regensburgei]